MELSNRYQLSQRTLSQVRVEKAKTGSADGVESRLPDQGTDSRKEK
ncbi:hypothetical protein X474_27990 [Dethiosulfatarculus sandiegensis]|uniref:Uncharacterized protein n=1 Tax=Dethiosulfatarculus sandiegensis TaxID=1429043 RepID=A0A0D2HJG8_9BACT|nr:hypothetical protein X474_27990 [Dethiosulfatarculus sandiegensis]